VSVPPDGWRALCPPRVTPPDARPVDPAVLSVLRGNHLEDLADRLVALVRDAPPQPLMPETVVVQSQGMGRWLSLRIARALGVAANIRFPLPGAFLWDTFRRLVPDVPESDPLARRVMVWHLRAILDDLEAAPGFAPLHEYLRAADECGSYELAVRIADLFDQYLVYRPHWIARWEAGADEGWQAALWRALVTRTTEPHRARVEEAALRALAAAPAEGSLPRRVAVFGIPTLPPAYLHGFRRLAEHTDVHLFLLAPCHEYWGDVKRSRRPRRGALAAVAPDAPGASLLASLGKQGRDFLDLVIDCDPHVDEPAFREPGDDSLLHGLQTDMLTLRAPAGRMPVAPGDRSLQVHVCHGPMREVEVLYDQLLWLFDQHPDLTAADVVVMTPDIEAYAPAIEAVFGGAPLERRIPFTIADRSLRADSTLVEAFLELLELPGSRYDADRLLSLLEAPAVYRRFGIAGGDLDLLQRLVAESAVRWGVDAAARARLGLPAVAENTWRYGLDRLLLGFALPSGATRLLDGVLPCDAVEGSDAQVLGRLGAFVEAAVALEESLVAPRSLTAWAATLTDVLDRFVDPGEAEAEAAQTLRSLLQHLADDAGRAGYATPVSLALVRVLLRRELDQSLGTGRFLTGGVTFCAMVPMRSIPFEVVCLIGMNDGSFPRTRQPPSFDLMAEHPERGDRSRRDDDRYLFLEAIVSARRCLYLSHVGRGIRDNAPIPPSIVVSELLEAVRGGYDVDERQLITEHPLQAFSPRYFADPPEPGMISYSAELCEASRVRRRQPEATRRLLQGRLPDPGPELQAADLDAFLEFFANPTAELLRRRLGVRLVEAELPALRREPFVLDGLGAYAVRNALLARHAETCAGIDPLPALRACGLLPYGRVGDVEAVRQRAVVDEFAERLGALTAGEPLEAIEFAIQLGALRLAGVLRNVARDGVIDHRLAKPKARDQLTLWIRHLILHVVKPRPEGWRSVWLGTQAIVFEPVAAARDVLQTLAGMYREGMQRLLPFFPESALEWCEATRAKLDAARAKWDGNDFVDGESADAYLVYAWREMDPLDAEFERLAELVMQPLVDHRTEEPS
jgi:exodeoxyribonuclease V gamma subunit